MESWKHLKEKCTLVILKIIFHILKEYSSSVKIIIILVNSWTEKCMEGENKYHLIFNSLVSIKMMWNFLVNYQLHNSIIKGSLKITYLKVMDSWNSLMDRNTWVFSKMESSMVKEFTCLKIKE